MQHKRGASRIGYHAHYVVDGGKARVILTVLVTPADVTENQPMLDLLWRTIFRGRARVRRVTGDATYGTKEIVAAVEKAATGAYVSMADRSVLHTTVHKARRQPPGHSARNGSPFHSASGSSQKRPSPSMSSHRLSVFVSLPARSSANTSRAFE